MTINNETILNGKSQSRQTNRSRPNMAPIITTDYINSLCPS